MRRFLLLRPLYLCICVVFFELCGETFATRRGLGHVAKFSERNDLGLAQERSALAVGAKREFLAESKKELFPGDQWAVAAFTAGRSVRSASENNLNENAAQFGNRV